MIQSKVIQEYGSIFRQSDYPEKADTFFEIYLDDTTFGHLKNFISENQDESIEIDVAFKLHRKGGKDFIKVKNYVGVIETKNKRLIEILPKVYLETSPDKIIATRRIFLRMLKCLRNSPFKSIDEAHLRTIRFPLFEIFIRTFLTELEILIKKGIKQYYISRKESQKVLRGRIDFPRHIAINILHREQFFVEYDEFSINIPQNRLIKSALNYLKGLTKSPNNYKDILKFTSILFDVPESNNFTSDFQKVFVQNRLYSYYDQVLKWAKVFLLGESFTNFKGNSLNKAILFPMEIIFQNYVASGIRKYLMGYDVIIQDRKHYLIEEHNGRKRFRLVPDLVFSDENCTYVADTKWKIINANEDSKNYGISQSDMYQLYAYGKKYSSDKNNIKLVLIYPKHENFKFELSEFLYELELPLEVVPFDLEINLNASINNVQEFIFGKQTLTIEPSNDNIS